MSGKPLPILMSMRRGAPQDGASLHLNAEWGHVNLPNWLPLTDHAEAEKRIAVLEERYTRRSERCTELELELLAMNASVETAKKHIVELEAQLAECQLTARVEGDFGKDARARIAELEEKFGLSRPVQAQAVSLADLPTEMQVAQDAKREPLTDDVKVRLRAGAVSPSHGGWTEDAVDRLIGLVAAEVRRALEARVSDLEEGLRKSLVIFDWMERRSIYQDAQVKEAHAAARHLLAQAWEQRCPRCGGAMKRGKALVSTVTGSPDFPGGEVVTLSAGGPGRLVDCLKCAECGHSVHARGRQTGCRE